ncbi:hypothetical protein [uncultured Tenacibaculum sp.]|uniref:hypothetical protein n=1 Tax=uncultured Tenacibaculum sp. TaxID=174713 RepID=UPI0026043483|nr:hypothetical protein [uncultured Tenacibaculum sp.]
MKTIITGYIFLFTLFSFSQTQEVLPIDQSFKQFISCRDFTLSTNGKEAYFTIQNLNESKAAIVKAENINNTWRNFEIVSFSGKHRDIEPFLSPNNLRLYFSSNRPKNKNGKEDDYDIWYVERKTINSKWSQPINLGTPVNTKHNEFYPSLSKKHNIYYTSDQNNKTSKDDILFAEWNGSNYEQPKVLNENINGKGYEFNAFIDPDENFLLYTIYKAKDGIGSGDLYISIKDEKGYFQKRKNLGNLINSERMDYCPFYDEKTNTLYFTSKRDNTKLKKTDSLSEFNTITNGYMNGQSRIYKVKIDLNNQ